VIDLKLSGKTIVSMLHEYTVIFRTDDGCSISIETDFTVTGADNVYLVVPSDNEDGEWKDLLLNQAITLETVDKGILRVDLANGATLTCAPCDRYEAWNVSGLEGQLVVSMPGGELALWGYSE
jgi:hypothetical protein